MSEVPHSVEKDPQVLPSTGSSAADEGPGPPRLEIDLAPAAILKVLGTLAILWVLSSTWQVIVWVAISLMFVATFHPLVRRLQTRLSRPWAIAAVVLVTLLGLAALLGVIIPSLVRQGQNLAASMPELLSRVEVLARSRHIQINLRAPAQEWARRVGPYLLNASFFLLRGMMGGLTVFILTIYLLIEGPQVGSNLLSLLPRRERLPIRRAFSEIGLQVGAYVRGQLITSALAGVFSLMLLSLLKVPEPLALAFVMAVADLIPLVGPLIATTPAVLMALSRGVPTAVIVLIAYLIYQQVEGNFIVPRVYGQVLKLSPFIVLIAFLIGGTLLGMLGALLALPVAAAIPILTRYIQAWRERTEAEGSGPVSLPSSNGG